MRCANSRFDFKALFALVLFGTRVQKSTEDLSSYVSLQTSCDLALRCAFGYPFEDVGQHPFVVAHAAERDGIQRPESLSVKSVSDRLAARWVPLRTAQRCRGQRAAALYL